MTLNNLRYADDIVLIATSPAALQQLLDKVSTVSKEYGLGQHSEDKGHGNGRGHSGIQFHL